MANKQYSASKWFREFGKALDPGVIKSSLYALLVGLIGGLVAQEAEVRGKGAVLGLVRAA